VVRVVHVEFNAGELESELVEVQSYIGVDPKDGPLAGNECSRRREGGQRDGVCDRGDGLCGVVAGQVSP
jgi:hypothetical protein